MKKKDMRPVVKIENGKVSICRKKRSENTYLEYFQTVNVDLSEGVVKPKFSDLCFIKVSSDIREKIKGNYCVVLNPDTGDFVDVLIDPDVITECTGEIFITNYVKRRACITNTSRIVICTENYDEFSKVRIQKMENIK